MAVELAVRDLMIVLAIFGWTLIFFDSTVVRLFLIIISAHSLIEEFFILYKIVLFFWPRPLLFRTFEFLVILEGASTVVVFPSERFARFI